MTTIDASNLTAKPPLHSLQVDRAVRRIKWSIFCGWSALGGLFLYGEWHFWMRTLHPPFTPVALLLAAMAGALLGLFWYTARLVRKLPAFTLLGLMAGLAPAGLLAWPLAYAADEWNARDAPANPSKNFATIFGAALMDMEAHWKYPHRLESQHLVMLYGDSVTAPESDLATMDAHVAKMEEAFGRKLREKILWIRGPVFGQSGVSFLGLSLGSHESPAAERNMDRHELAHGVIVQFRPAASDPPALLIEGWAQANSGIPDEELSRQALEQRAEEPSQTITQLLSKEWYHRHVGAVYSVGGAFANYLLRRFGHKTFLDYYVRSRPGGAASTTLILGVDLNTLERDFWKDAERIGQLPSKVGPPDSTKATSRQPNRTGPCWSRATTPDLELFGPKTGVSCGSMSARSRSVMREAARSS